VATELTIHRKHMGDSHQNTAKTQSEGFPLKAEAIQLRKQLEQT